MRGAPKEEDDFSRIRKNPVMMFGAREKVNQEIDNYSYLAKLKVYSLNILGSRNRCLIAC